MTAKKSFWLLPLLSICMFLAGCSSDSTPAPLSKTDLLCKTWIIEESSVAGSIVYKRGANNNSVNYSSSSITFSKPNIYSSTYNNNTGVGTWKFLNNETSLEVSGGGSTSVSTIVKLSSSNFDSSNGPTTTKWIPK